MLPALSAGTPSQTALVSLVMHGRANDDSDFPARGNHRVDSGGGEQGVSPCGP